MMLQATRINLKQGTAYKLQANKGQILAEIILIVAVIAGVMAISGELIFTSFRSQESAKRKTGATHLMQDALESLRAVRDFDDPTGTYGSAVQGWNRIYLPPDGSGDAVSSKGLSNPYHIEEISGRLVLIAGAESVAVNNETFTRRIIIDNVSRDPITRAIESVYNPSNDDPSTQKITLIMSQPQMSDLQTVQYFSRSRNDACAQTDWSGGALATVTPATLSNCQSLIYYDSLSNLNTASASLKLIEN